MTHVAIVADSDDRAVALAAQLEEDQLEITSQLWADVILCAGLSQQRLPRGGKPLVVLNDFTEVAIPFDDQIKAWLPSNASLAQISAALLAAAAGFTLLTAEQVQQTWQLQPAKEEVPDLLEPLTRREEDVLQMMTAGLGNKTIAARLQISPHTVKFHVRQIMAKLGAESRTEAVSTAIRRGLVAI